MHVSAFPFDLSHPLIQFIFTAFVIVVGILHLVKTTASKYFVVDANFEEGRAAAGGERERLLLENRFKNRDQMVAVAAGSGDGCAVCGKDGAKQCSRCRHVRYCSTACQSKHWKEGHNKKCQELKSFGGLNGTLSASSSGAKASICDSKSGKALQQLKKVLFPYEDFVKLFNWENGGFRRPSGLLNCGNSCYANVVLQCLSCTRPLVAYLLEIGHVGKCKRNDWCFLCELQIHVARARHSWQPFSPLNILSRLPNIGGNLGYGKQEDAHEFMRFAIDTMQSVCLDEFGGEKALHPSSQETTLIQYIFGGHLQSQVKCSKCNKISYRHENMMDLTVEIQGDAESLEECLDQFTAEEWLDGENMYKCDGCNDYVRACKRLAIHQAPNVLTIALKRFQSGRFGKLNKRVTFPETLDVGPYMSKPGYGTDVYELYAVVVHIDMLNASYFGHYICYTKDFHGNWYRIDDCKVINVELEEVLSQGAYMLLYSRMCVRPSCVKPLETYKEEKQEGVVEAQPYSQAAVETVNTEGPIKSFNTIDNMSTVISTTEEEKQGVDVAEEAHPCLELPDQSTTVEGSLTSVSIIPTAARSPIMELSSEREEAVCMDLDDPVEVNTRFNREDLTVAAGDIFIESESGSPNMDLDGPGEIDLMFARGDQPGLYLDNSESSSFGTRLDCGSKHSDATGTTSVEIYHEGLLTSVPLTEASPSVEARSTGSEASGTNSEDCQFEDGNTTIGSKDSIINEVPVVNSLPNESVIQKLPETSCSFPSSLNSDKKILQGESSSFHSLSKPMFAQVQAVNSANNIPAAQNRKGNTLKLTGDRSCSNAKQKPLFSPGFLDKRPRCKSPNKNANVMVKPWEVGTSCKVSSNCNGINKPGGSHISVSRKHDVVVEPVGFVTAERSINSVSTIPTDLRPPTMNLIPEKDNAVCRNFDNPVEVGSRFTREDPAATTAEVPVHSESMSLDLGPDGPTGIDLMSTRGDQLDLDFDYPGSSSLGMKLDDCGSKHSNASGIASPVEIHKGGVRFVNNTPSAQCSKEHIIKSAGDESCCNKSPLGNGKVLVKPGEVGMSCKVVEPGEDCSSESSYAGECGPAHIANGIAVSVPLTEAYDLRQELKDPEYDLTESFGNGRVDGCNMSASETVGSLPRLMDHQMEEISLNVPAASSSDKEMLDDSNHVIGSQNWQSPDLVQIASVESVHDICASSETEGLSSNMNNGDSCSRSLNSVFSHSSYDEQTRGRFQKRNNAPEGLAEVGSSCKANNYKEFAGHGSLLQNGTQASNYDSKVDRDTSFKTTKLMDNQREKIYMDEDERMVKEIVEVGDPLSWHCNGNGSCNNFDKMKNCQGESVSWGNGKEVFSPSFLNKPSRKKAKSLKKDDEVSSLGETVSSNHDKNKMPRFG